MKPLLGDYTDDSAFNTATQVDFNQLSTLPERRDQGLEQKLRADCVALTSSRRILECENFPGRDGVWREPPSL